MITTERQYKITKKQVEELVAAKDNILQKVLVAENNKKNALELEARSLLSLIDEFQDELREYEAVRSGAVSVFEVNAIDDLPKLLIKSRIASGMTQAQFAEKLGMKEQQLQRYEADEYGSLSLKKLIQFAEILNVRINGDAKLAVEQDEDIWKKFPIAEMLKRNWFPSFTGSLKQAKDNAEELLKEFFFLAGSRADAFVFHKKKVRLGRTTNPFSLQVWHARIIQKALDIFPIPEFKFEVIDEKWIKNLVQLSSKHDWAPQVFSYLKDSGIKLVFESHLENTYLDGAALMLGKNPVIALTLRYDRIDNFWFVLLHEIAHIKLHFKNGEYTEFFDDLDVDIDGIEDDADKFALNALIDDNIWRKSIARFSQSEAAVIAQARQLNIHPALIAGRIRKETQKYHLLTKLVGNGEVKKNFSQYLD